FPFVRFTSLDLTREPEDQGHAAASCDIVVAANVVHVTPDLSATGRRLLRLLKPGGVLVLYEMTAVPDFATATFGLLDGWWNFTDARLPRAPLLSAPGWDALLRSAGFADVRLFGLGGASDAEYRHAVIAAQARQTDAAAPATRSSPLPARGE